MQDAVNTLKSLSETTHSPFLKRDPKGKSEMEIYNLTKLSCIFCSV